MITAESVLGRSRDLVSSDIDGEVVMMSIEKGRYYGMDAIASRIWDLLGERVKVSDMIGTLTEEYDVNREDCERDVLGFLNELLSEKLVEIVS